MEMEEIDLQDDNDGAAGTGVSTGGTTMGRGDDSPAGCACRLSPSRGEARAHAVVWFLVVGAAAIRRRRRTRTN